MPQRKITVPPPIRITDPTTGESTSEELTFRNFLERLFQNPVWNESVKHALAQQSIANAARKAEDGKLDHFVISDTDWAFAEKCAKEPKVFLPNGQTINGFGNLPQMARYFISFQQAIINAEEIA